MKLIVGLGNPGDAYLNTRHNAGFLAVDALAMEEDGAWKTDDKRKADIYRMEIDGEDVIIAKPHTFMNLSGDAVQALTSFYHIGLNDMLIVHDEMDLPPGRLQLKPGGGDAGHNGLSSIIERLGTDQFPRLRIGVGRPPADSRQPTADYVLGPLSPDDAPNALDVTDIMRDWIGSGMEKAMNKWNSKPRSE